MEGQKRANKLDFQRFERAALHGGIAGETKAERRHYQLLPTAEPSLPRGVREVGEPGLAAQKCARIKHSCFLFEAEQSATVVERTRVVRLGGRVQSSGIIDEREALKL